MRRPEKQKGMTAIGWLLVILLVGFFALVVIKLVPVYLEGFKISDSMNSLAKASDARHKGPQQLQSDLLTRLNINMVYDIHRDDIQVTRSQDGYSMEIDYEPRVHLFGNLYFVVVFDKTVDIPSSNNGGG